MRAVRPRRSVARQRIAVFLEGFHAQVVLGLLGHGRHERDVGTVARGEVAWLAGVLVERGPEPSSKISYSFSR